MYVVCVTFPLVAEVDVPGAMAESIERGPRWIKDSPPNVIVVRVNGNVV